MIAKIAVWLWLAACLFFVFKGLDSRGHGFGPIELGAVGLLALGALVLAVERAAYAGTKRALAEQWPEVE